MELWTAERAHLWFAAQPWLVGCNFTPSTAINQLEMWQSETFDLPTIERELDLARSVGMNAIRIYLHDLLWAADGPRFLDRVDQVLAVSASRGLRAMLVLFDSCWHPQPTLGPQPIPRDGVHNSGWVQSPGAAALADASQHGRLEDYVKAVIGRFGSDPRVLAWDIWNEPDNGPEVAVCAPQDLAEKAALVVPLMVAAFGWARSLSPAQPLTSGIWLGDWSAPDLLSPIQRAQTANSDIITFHNYGVAEDFVQRVKWLKAYGRPILCTEFMARPAGSTFEAILPQAKSLGVGVFCWGLVRGKTQTHLPWTYWANPQLDGLKDRWFHDIFEPCGAPYDPSEVELLRLLTQINEAVPGAAQTA